MVLWHGHCRPHRGMRMRIIIKTLTGKAVTLYFDLGDGVGGLARTSA